MYLALACPFFPTFTGFVADCDGPSQAECLQPVTGHLCVGYVYLCVLCVVRLAADMTFHLFASAPFPISQAYIVILCALSPMMIIPCKGGGRTGASCAMIKRQMIVWTRTVGEDP